MKAVLICGGIAVGLMGVVLIATHAKCVCRCATIFMDHY